MSELHIYDDLIICPDCGEDNDIAYIEQYANGCEYQCKKCKRKFMYDQPTANNEVK